MHVAIVGLGSIGKRHLQNIRQIEPASQITVVRHRNTGEPAPLGADRVVYSLAEASRLNPDIAFICGPTSQHVDAALHFAQHGAHLFVEKPLAATAADAESIAEAARAAGKLLIVGYNLRFLPSLELLVRNVHAGAIGRPLSVRAEIGQYLPDWRPGTDYRKGNTARAGLGGGILLELSHEIDYVRWMVGDPVRVSCMMARLSDLEIEIDDTAEILMRTSSPSLISIHLDLTQRTPTRTCRVVGTGGTLAWDGIAGTLQQFVPETGWTTLYEGDPERNEMYLEQTRHVFACVRGSDTPRVTAEDGVRVVEIIEAAARASAEGREVGV